MAASQGSLIQQSPLCGGLYGGQIGLLANVPRIIRNAAGVLIFDEGGPGDCYDRFLCGEVMVGAYSLDSCS